MKSFILLMLIVSCVSCRNLGGKMKRNKFSNHIIHSQPPMSETFISSIEMSLSSCQEAFKWDRWNCPSRQFFAKRTSNHIDREQAFVKALTTAGLIYSHTKNCSQGDDRRCGCNLNLVDIAVENLDGGDFVWSGCSDNIDLGEQMANDVVNFKNLSGSDLISYANWHNSRAGIISVRNSLKKLCRCHGFSGTCSLKSCWMSMNTFSAITYDIKRMYEESVILQMDNSGNLDIYDIKEDQLVYIVESPDYCKVNAVPGWKGMVNRQCSRSRTENSSIYEKKSCKTLCKSCGLRVRRQVSVEKVQCNCKFNWCCDVSCETCNQFVDEYYCE